MKNVPSEAKDYAQRVWKGQSSSLPRVERVRRIGKALEGQGMDMAATLSPLSPVEIDKLILQTALPAFGHGRLEAVNASLAGTGLDVADVLAATKRYLALKTRKARKERLHS